MIIYKFLKDKIKNILKNDKIKNILKNDKIKNILKNIKNPLIYLHVLIHFTQKSNLRKIIIQKSNNIRDLLIIFLNHQYLFYLNHKSNNIRDLLILFLNHQYLLYLNHEYNIIIINPKIINPKNHTQNFFLDYLLCDYLLCFIVPILLLVAFYDLYTYKIDIAKDTEKEDFKKELERKKQSKI